MRALFSPRSWSYEFGHDPNVDFCFWVLERDGLRVPPFDRHPDGNGLLRAAGLDPASWRAWLERNLAAGAEQAEIVLASKHRKADFERLRALEPAARWDGTPAVGRRLVALAEEYDEIFNERASSKLELARTHAQCEARLWKDLAPYRRTLPPVQIITVGYPGPVQTVVAPKSILLAVGNWAPMPSELADAILEGMRALAEVSQPAPQDVA